MTERHLTGWATGYDQIGERHPKTAPVRFIGGPLDGYYGRIVLGWLPAVGYLQPCENCRDQRHHRAPCSGWQMCTAPPGSRYVRKETDEDGVTVYTHNDPTAGHANAQTTRTDEPAVTAAPA